jgi:exopolysaccharide biosynthesis polyprenyl glycosylphosphotransferase
MAMQALERVSRRGCSEAVHHSPLVRSFAKFWWRLTLSLGVAFILPAAFYILFPQTRSPLVTSILVVLGLLVPLPAASYEVRRRRQTQRVLIVGTTPLACKLIDEIEARRGGQGAIVGVADDARAGDRPQLRYPILGPLERFDEIIEEVRPDRIIVAMAGRHGRLPVPHLLDARLGGIVVEDGVEVWERLTGKIALESLPPNNLISGTGWGKSRVTLAVSRAMSLLASVVGLVCLAPVIGLIALAIKLDSPGPVFFVQDRVGWCGRPFKLIKFRTMHPIDGETPLWFRDSHERITQVGKWLRKFRLDELPQFVNILRGDMNLVGPRPHRVRKFELFVETIPYFWLRSLVRPGLTGWAQVRHGYASNLEEETEKTWYDLYYIKRMSPWFDLRILFGTVKVVLSDRGSRSAAPAWTEARADGKTRKRVDTRTPQSAA